jgi:hypothetical protein
MLENVIENPLLNAGHGPTPDRPKPRAGSGLIVDLSRSTMDVVVPRCGRIQLVGGKKVNRPGTRRTAIPAEWLPTKFAWRRGGRVRFPVILRCLSVAEASKDGRPGCNHGRTSFEARLAMLAHREPRTSSDERYALAQG